LLYTKDVNLTDDTLTTILTVPSGYVAHWSLLFASNHDGSTKTLTVYIDKVSGGDIYIIDDKNISSKDFLQFSDGVFVLQPGDAIKAQGDTTCDFTVACTVDIQPAPQVTVEFNGS